MFSRLATILQAAGNLILRLFNSNYWIHYLGATIQSLWIMLNVLVPANKLEYIWKLKSSTILQNTVFIKTIHAKMAKVWNKIWIMQIYLRYVSFSPSSIKKYFQPFQNKFLDQIPFVSCQSSTYQMNHRKLNCSNFSIMHNRSLFQWNLSRRLMTDEGLE